jgi:hypothetical protein
MLLCEDIKNNIDYLGKVLARLFNNNIIQNRIIPGIGLPFQLFHFDNYDKILIELKVIEENF